MITEVGEKDGEMEKSLAGAAPTQAYIVVQFTAN